MHTKFWKITSVLLALVLAINLAISVQSASAQEEKPDQAPWGRNGQTAVDQLGSDIDQLAASYQLSPEVLRERLLTDPTLWIDNQDLLVFMDDFLPPVGFTEVVEPYNQQALAPYDQTFLLHSFPGGSKVIYLDFNGHTTTGTPWNNSYGATIVSAPFDLDGSPSTWSVAEMERIQYIWQRVAEDYLPYGVDVTTEDPGVEGLRKTATGDEYYGQRVVISPTNWYSTNAGGVAYIGSFNWNTDTPTFVFTAQLGNGNEKYTAEAASHETGHTVGLYHDGTTAGVTYYEGHGNWAPIMGVGYYREIVQFSKGEYAAANNTEDDLAIMTGYGFTYRADDHGNTKDTATPLTITDSVNANGKGIIGRTTDKDYFSFMTGSGTVNFSFNPGPRSPNLDISAELFDASGSLLTSSNPAGLAASFSISLTAGTYFVAVDGIGTGDPSTGYSDYGSLGEFNISGTIVSPGTLQPPNAVASAVPTNGNLPLTVTFTGSTSSDPDGPIVSYAWNFGDGGSANIADPSHTYGSVGVYTAVLTVTDDDNLTDTASVTITVTAPPAAPTGLSASAISTSQINLAWTDNANNETGFKVERSLNSIAWSQIATVGADVKTYSNTGLTANTLYYYRVSAYNTSGDSGYSGIASATTPATPSIHVGDLDGSRTVTNKSWKATVTITVHDANHSPVSGVTVSGTWSAGATGSATCTTNTSGVCAVTKSNIKSSVTSVNFSISNLVKAGYSYNSSLNHDVDGGSNGTFITVTKLV